MDICLDNIHDTQKHKYIQHTYTDTKEHDKQKYKYGQHTYKTQYTGT